jgi:hypothetical protein
MAKKEEVIQVLLENGFEMTDELVAAIPDTSVIREKFSTTSSLGGRRY